MAKRRSYFLDAEKLKIVIDIAIESLEKKRPENLEEQGFDTFLSFYKKERASFDDIEDKFKNLTSLKYQIDAVFTYFQEGTGDTVEYFWKRLKEENLDYKRVNKLAKILKRGNLRGDIEYNYVTDIIVIALQSGMINDQEYILLSNMIGDYEIKKM